MDMRKLAFALGAGILVTLLVVPFLPIAEDGGGRAPAAHTSAPSPSATIPSEYEAPPLWNEENILGTAWEAGLGDMPMIDDPDSVLRIQYYFIAPGQIRVSFKDEEVEAANAAGQALFQTFLPDSEGDFRIDGAQIHVTARIFGADRTDIIEIRGDRLYYHEAEMTPLHEEEPAGALPGAPPHGFRVQP